MRAGDSLASIAAQLWGDASLWYKLAQANGLGADTALAAGQTLTVPAGITRAGNNAATFNPYNPADAYGDTSPTTPAPQAAARKKGCGILGQILQAVISLVVIAVTAPFIGLAPAAMLGSAVSQGFGILTGIQDKFSFKAVAVAGIATLATAGAGAVFGQGAVLGSQLLGDVVRGVAANVLTQGVSVATGLQDKFDWAGVAAAGVSAGLGRSLGSKLGALGPVGGAVATGGARLIANAATRSLVNGNDFGDNIVAALPDVIAQTIGDAIANLQTDRPNGRGAASNSQAQATTATGDAIDPLFTVDANGHLIVGNTATGFSVLPPSSPFGEDLANSLARSGLEASLQRPMVERIAASEARLAAAGQGIAGGTSQPVMLLGTGSIPDMQSGGDPYWKTYQQYGKNPKELADWLIQNRYIGNSDITSDYADRMIVSSDYWHLQRYVLGPLNDAARLFPENANLALLRDRVADYVTQAQIPGDKGVRDAFAGLGKLELEIAKGALTPVAAADVGYRVLVNGERPGFADVLAAAPVLGTLVRDAHIGSTIVEEVGAAKAVHKNSLQYVGDTHVYVIRRADGSLYKVGESAQGVRVADGASIRAEQQARRLTRETGEFYTSEIIKNFGGKADARAYETRVIRTYERLFGKRPPGNLLDR
ncbi:MAG: LysM peptidoglycan-binding domain-containing protein [Sphingomonas sp.]|uniref:LysM peptidoglycan-binding domain-containing protein n=1 Tax=Sphingomonas sp. TaxID=28214 RepID=UPI001ACB1C56|nr:LysM peptidoglycan-binding domain-containing protein [Sphingomonas sp.]MBN8809384.1 LysM peptidoglycan-binding domain-containing protein [Sphingomonas sp.]